MDSRCPRKLKKFPDQPCPLAVQRLKILAKMNKNTAADKDEELDGCSYYCMDGDSNYCFFYYIAQNEGKTHTPIEIAEKLLVTQPATYLALSHGLRKLRHTQTGKLIDNYKKKNKK